MTVKTISVTHRIGRVEVGTNNRTWGDSCGGFIRDSGRLDERASVVSGVLTQRGTIVDGKMVSLQGKKYRYQDLVLDVMDITDQEVANLEEEWGLHVEVREAVTTYRLVGGETPSSYAKPTERQIEFARELGIDVDAPNFHYSKRALSLEIDEELTK